MSLSTLLLSLLTIAAQSKYLEGGGRDKILKFNGNQTTFRIGFGSCYDEY